MQIIKKLLGLTLVCAIAIGLVACKKDEETNENELVVWSFTEETLIMSKYFEEWYKEEYDKDITVKVEIIPMDEYTTKTLPALKSGTGPDVLALEIAFLKQFTEGSGRNYIENLSEEPYNATDYEDQFLPYVMDLAKDPDGNIMGMTWQATPGGVYYRMDVAEKIGLTEEQVNTYFETEEGMKELGNKLKENGYFLFPNGGDTWYFNEQTRDPWVVDGKFNLLPETGEYFQNQKDMYDNGVTSDIGNWSPEWFGSMALPVEETNIFSYILPSWGLYNILMTSTDDPDDNPAWGQYRTTPGPEPYYWGGTWMSLTSESKKKDLGWEFIKYITTNQDFYLDWSEETSDFFSNTIAIDAVKDNSSTDFLGGQSLYDIYYDSAMNIDASNVTKYDNDINQIRGSVAQDYVNGIIPTLDEALEKFENDVRTAFPELD